MVRRGLLTSGFCLLAVYSTLAQDWTFGEVQKLSAGINSDAEESMPILSPDGKTLYFTRVMYEGNVGGRFAGHDIWFSKFEGGKWSKAQNHGAAFRNSKKNNAVVGISRDGKTLYLFESAASQKVKGIYFSRNTNGLWGDPELIPLEGITPEGFVGFYVSPDFDAILISMRGPDSRGEEDLYVSVKEASGSWSLPKNLGNAINTTGFEISPFLTEDKKRLFFSSNGHPGLGDGDIFYSDRLYNSWETWTTPRNLGKTINTKNFEGYFSVASDTLGLLASNRSVNLSEIFTTRVSTVPGRPISEKMVLTSQEFDGIFGKNANAVFDFRGTDTKLAIPEQEMLFYLATKVVSVPGLSLQFNIKEENKPELSKARLDGMLLFIRDAGLPDSRILIPELSVPKRSADKMLIELVFLKEVTN